jgi:uncharacterized protein (UPF0276 family)
MSANRFNSHARLGVGLGLRAPHVAHVLAERPAIDWFEIVAENFMVDGGRPRDTLERVAAHYPVIPHGVALYLGAAQGLDRAHLARWKALLTRVRPPWISDHLCWGSVDGGTSHDLLPLPYTPEVARLCAAAIRQIQDTLETPFAIENVSSYAEFRGSTMTEWAFLAEVAEQADCGILLDVNNVYVSSVNHGFDPRAYLAAIPADRVAQIHLAGHAAQHGFIVDTHDRPVAEPVWQLYAETIARLGPTPTLLEWDAELPSLAELTAEAARAQGILAAAGRDAR